MSEARGKTYRRWNPQHYRHEAHSPEAKLPQADLVFFLLDTVVVRKIIGGFSSPQIL